MSDYAVLQGDCLEVMPTLDANSIDAVICDPPYGLKFMGKTWDHGVPGVPFWEAALRVAKPGAYLLAFGGTRTYHRLTCAIEDAGWEIHDGICTWLYGSGFPKHRSKLKPAWEPIIVAWKPAKKASPLNIDACRLATHGEELREGSGGIPCRNDEASSRRRYTERGGTGFAALPGVRGGSAAGRWPANVILDEESAALLDEQSGELTSNSGGAFTRNTDKFRHTFGAFAGEREEQKGFYGDSGGASRFFYCAKTSRAERDAGLDGQRKPLHWSAGAQNPGSFQSDGTDKTARNHHPTVKPLALMRWLCKLVTPSGGTILDPFTGSGSTGCAAALEGFRFIGIEREPEFVDVARARIAHHASQFVPTFDLGGAA